jgi:hypothetical protein
MAAAVCPKGLAQRHWCVWPLCGVLSVQCPFSPCATTLGETVTRGWSYLICAHFFNLNF